MGQEQSSQMRQIFEKLDTDHNGILSLRDILTIQAGDGIEHLIHNSPLLLYRFDKEGTGNINYQGFSKLMHYVKSKEKSIRQRSGLAKPMSKVWCTITRETADSDFLLNRESNTPAITGLGPSSDDYDSIMLEQDQANELAEEISRDAGQYFDYTIRMPEGRKKFVNWLFLMADLDNNKKVSINELKVMIQALRHDGINPEDLTYDPVSFLKATEIDSCCCLSSNSPLPLCKSDVQKSPGQRQSSHTRRSKSNSRSTSSLSSSHFIPLLDVHEDHNRPHRHHHKHVTPADVQTNPTELEGHQVHDHCPQSDSNKLDQQTCHKHAICHLHANNLIDIKELDRQQRDHRDNILALQLLKEYDVESIGYLTPLEFDVLANLIVMNYEFRHDQYYLDVSSHNPLRHLEGYRLMRQIGKGANAQVRLAVDVRTGQHKAIKIMSKGNVADLSRIDNEIRAMMILKHPCVVRLEQVLENDTHVFFVMEFCGGGPITSYLDGKPMSESLARFYFSKIVECVDYCHEQGIAHRDLKPDNILLDNDANIKITDFGHARIYQMGWDLFSTPLFGGLCHLAPEQITAQPYSGEKHDVWSLGMILYILCTGLVPFTSKDSHQLIDDILNLRYEIPDYVPLLPQQMIRSMLLISPNSRPSIKEIAKHEWLKQGQQDVPILKSFTLPVPKNFWARYRCSCESMCHALKLLGIEPVFNAATIKVVEDEHDMVRCHWPAKDIKFSFQVKELRPDMAIMFFKLSSGASRDFLTLVNKLRDVIDIYPFNVVDQPLVISKLTDLASVTNFQSSNDQNSDTKESLKQSLKQSASNDSNSQHHSHHHHNNHSCKQDSSLEKTDTTNMPSHLKHHRSRNRHCRHGSKLNQVGELSVDAHSIPGQSHLQSASILLENNLPLTLKKSSDCHPYMSHHQANDASHHRKTKNRLHKSNDEVGHVGRNSHMNTKELKSNGHKLRSSRGYITHPLSDSLDQNHLQLD